MYLSLVNLFPILLTFSAAFGVLFHDSQLDRATVTAFNAPVAATVDTSLNSPLKFSDYHIHTESSSEQLQTTQPTAQPRGEDKKYIVNKKLVSSSIGSDYSWPSI